MFRAVIIDDEQNAIRSLELLIKKFVTDLQVMATSSDPRKAVDLINDLRPNIVFLDINMPHMNGFEFLEKLSFHDFHLIFTTAHQQYGLRAIKSSASGYLLKPIDSSELVDTLNRVKKKIAERSFDSNILSMLRDVWGLSFRKITLPSRSRVELVLPQEISWIEADSSDCRVCLRNIEVLEVSRSLKDLESILCIPTLSFMRVHNSFIVNLEMIDRFIKEDNGIIVMKDKKRIPLSKSKREEFLKNILS